MYRLSTLKFYLKFVNMLMLLSIKLIDLQGAAKVPGIFKNNLTDYNCLEYNK